MKSINEGPFQMGTLAETLAEETEGALQQGPVRARVFTDLSAQEKERYKADIRTTNILLQGTPKDIYTLIHHYTDAKDIWDNVKMILEECLASIKFVDQPVTEWSRFITGVKLNRGLKESNFDQLYAYLKQHEEQSYGSRTGELWSRCPWRYNRDIIKEGPFSRNNCKRKCCSWECGGQITDGGNVKPSQAKPIKCYNYNGLGHIARECPRPKRLQDSDYFKDKMLLMQAQENGAVLDEEQLLFLAGEQVTNFDDDVDDPTEKDLALNVYVEDNEEIFIQSNVSSVQNDALMSIINEMHEDGVQQGVQSRLANKPDKVVNDSLTSELARYKELVREYEKRAKFELTDRERKIDEQMRIIISDRNRKETSLKSELHSVQMQLRSTLGHYKSKTEEVTILKKDFKQKEDKFLEEFLDIKRLKEKVEDRLYKQDQSVQTVHMLCKPKSFYDEKNKVAIGYKNPLYLTHAKQVQSALYNGHEIVKTNHAPPVVHDSEDTREIAEITRKRMLEKMKSPLCVENKVKIAPPDYSKENLLATFAPQRDLTPEQIFWSKDVNEIKRAETSVPKPLSALMVYPPNTPVKLVPRVLPIKKEFKWPPLKKLKESKKNLIKYQQRVDQITVDKHILKAEISNYKRRIKRMLMMNDKRSCEPYNAKDVTALIEQNDCVRVKLEKVKQHYNELYDSIKITHAHTSEKTSTVLNEIESLKAQLRSNESYFTSDSVKPKVLALGIHLKEIVEIVREIIEEARVVKPLDNILNYACQYTKLSQELLEYVIGTCPKSFNERDNKAPSIPVTRKKQVTFNDKSGTSSSNTQKHEVHQKVQQTNVLVIHSTGVNTSIEASRSKPRSNTKKNRILPAKSENKKKVEDHHRTNNSVWTKVNRVDSSISFKCVVINLNSESVCQTCNKCLNSTNHEMCVVNILSFVNATPTVKIILNKGKRIWKPKGKLSDNSLNKTKQVWKVTGKLFADIGYQWKPTRKKFTLSKI
ncbi:retrovirus-related pol polyprotein from transposon TNT 1-94 [Tanacetum coccineum]